MAIVLDGTTGITTPSVASTGASTFTGALALPSGGLNVGSGQLAVDASGRVTMSSQPSWNVGLAATQTFNSSGQIILWNQTSGNGCFVQGGVTLNGANGRITVPVAGKYALFASLRTEATGANTGTNINFRLNGTTLQRFYVGTAINSGGSYMYIEPRPYIVSCAANDYIDLQFDSIVNTFDLSAASNTVVRFHGFLIG